MWNRRHLSMVVVDTPKRFATSKRLYNAAGSVSTFACGITGVNFSSRTSAMSLRSSEVVKVTSRLFFMFLNFSAKKIQAKNMNYLCDDSFTLA